MGKNRERKADGGMRAGGGISSMGCLGRQSAVEATCSGWIRLDSGWRCKEWGKRDGRNETLNEFT
jgi:hypothetical protein